MNMTLSNFVSNKGNTIANQFIIECVAKNEESLTFQSYKTKIAVIEKGGNKLTLDENALDYSKTTLKYLKIFLSDNLSGFPEVIKKSDIIAKLQALDIELIITDLN
jgi:hypothetical protein